MNSIVNEEKVFEVRLVHELPLTIGDTLGRKYS
jgi:hypothetical protein